MADNKTIDNGGLSDFTIASDEIGGVDYQRVKIVDGTDGSTAEIQGTAANGLEVDVTRIATGAAIQVTDGTSTATVRNLASNDALNVALTDGSGNHITSLGGTGGTAAADDADFTALTTQGTPVMGVYESSPTSVTDNDMGIVGIDVNRRVKVSVDASTLDVAHDAADSGNPVKIGGKAQTATPTPVASGDRTDWKFTTYGAGLVASMDPGQQVWKSGNYTTTQTSTIVWDPAAGKKIAVTHLQVNSYGTTAGRIILYFGTGAYVEGTNQPVFKGKHSPSATVTPGALPAMPHPLYSATADAELRITTDAGISLDVVLYGFEF